MGDTDYVKEYVATSTPTEPNTTQANEILTTS